MTTDSRARLAPWLESLGAEPTVVGGFTVPVNFGRPEHEAEVLATGCGLLDHSMRSRFELVGYDRARFLNGLVTHDVAALEPGEGGYGFLTDRSGRVVADIVTWILEDRIWCDLPRQQARQVREHLEGFIVADRVEVRPLSDLEALVLAGVGLLPALEKAQLDWPPQRWERSRVVVGESELELARHELLGVPAAVLLISSSLVSEVVPLLLEVAEPVGFAAWNEVRVEAGVAVYGLDYDYHLPQETGLAELAVSFDKGCYLGQEIVARLHYRGKVPRKVHRLAGRGELPKVGSALELGEKTVGQLTSISGVAGAWTGLGMLKRVAWEAASPHSLRVAEDGQEVQLLATRDLAQRQDS